MMSYVQFHLDYGKVDGAQLLSEANARQMQTPQMVLAGPIAAMVRDGDEIGDASYGLGLMVGSYRGYKHVRHGGGIDGFISAMEWLPNERIGAVVLTNTSVNGTTPTLVARNVFDRLLGLEPIDWTGRAREREKKAEAAAEEAKTQARTDQKEGTSPSHDLTDYVGSYEHHGYGIAEVEAEGGMLQVSAVGFEFPVEHYHYDVFVVPDDLPPPLSQLGGTKLLFRYGRSGDIDQLLIPLEPSVADIVFERLGDESMNEISFLKKLTGEYELSGVVATVALRGEALSLTVPGQPVLNLVPDRGTAFKIEGLDGFRVEFELAEGAATASAVTLFQPNGTFVAKRK